MVERRARSDRECRTTTTCLISGTARGVPRCHGERSGWHVSQHSTGAHRNCVECALYCGVCVAHGAPHPPAFMRAPNRVDAETNSAAQLTLADSARGECERLVAELEAQRVAAVAERSQLQGELQVRFELSSKSCASADLIV